MKPENAVTAFNFFNKIIFHVHLQHFASKVLFSAHNFNVNVALFAA